MQRERLTPERIRKFCCPEGQAQAFLWDTDSPRLAVRATGSSKSFVFETKLNRKTIRITIGDVRAWTPEQARAEANRLLSMTDQGIDPRQDKKERMAAAEARLEAEELASRQVAEVVLRKKITLGEAWAAYIEDRRDKWSDRHLLDHRRVIQEGGVVGDGKLVKKTKPRVLASLAALPLSALTPERVEEWLRAESKTRGTQAALAFRLLRAFLNWCAETPKYRGIASPDACATKRVRENVPKSSAKDDALQREQLRLWFEGVRSIQNRRVSVYLQGMLITGARPNELAGLLWADVDFDWGSLTLHDKVEGERTIPLTQHLAGLLRELRALNQNPPPAFRILHGRKVANDLDGWKPSDMVFGSRRSESGQIENAGTIHRTMLRNAGLPNVTLHGLRRSFGSLSEWLECPVGIVAQIQGHKPSATAEKHYRVRPLDLLRMWHSKIESWMLEQAGIQPRPVSEVGQPVQAVA